MRLPGRQVRLSCLYAALLATGGSAAVAEAQGYSLSGESEYLADDVLTDDRPVARAITYVGDMEPVGYDQSPNERISELEQELAAIKRRLDLEGSVQLTSARGPVTTCNYDEYGPNCGCGCYDGGSCCCGESCCGGYNRRPPGLYAGFSFVFAKPHYKESFQATHIDLAAAQMNLIPFDFDFELAPRVWIGYLGPQDRGFQFQYWLYDHDGNSLTEVADAGNVYGAQTVTVVIPAAISTVNPGDVLHVTNALRFETFDLEGVKRYYLGDSRFLVSGGLRGASVEQNYLATVSTSGFKTQSLRTFRTFEGVGPTIGALALVPSGMPHVEFVGQFRAALLYGEKSLGRELSPAQPISGTMAPDLSGVLLDSADEVFGGGGVELGLVWSRPTRGGDLFCQASYSGELWTEAGAPTLTFLGFEGFSVAVGLNR